MSQSALQPGQRLGPFQILEELGRGGMAVVYKAHDPRHGRTVALKVLPAYFQHDRQFVDRFRREADAARRLRHPNIVQVYGTGEAGGMPYMDMEYAAGGSLQELLVRQRGPLELRQAAGYTRQVAAALEYAHSQGVIHRDLKPSNVLLSGDGRVLLSDFGIAKVLGRTTLTASGAIIGTPAYMSPEQAQGQRGLDRRSDVYGLGVLLFQMLTGRAPFEADTPLVVMRAVCDDPPPRPRDLNRRIPAGVEGVILRALEKDPARRFATAGEMVAALDAVLYPMLREE